MKTMLAVMTAMFMLLAALSVDEHALAQSKATHDLAPRRMTSYPTMLDMTFPEFEAASKKIDVMLLPIGAIEEHGPHLPLGTDALASVAQVSSVQNYLRDAGYDALVGPPLNIGITHEGDGWKRDGTYCYPGSLTVSPKTFVALYVDVLHSLHDNGMRRIFLYSGHLGGLHLSAIAQAVEEANRTIPGLDAYALIDSERLEHLDVKAGAHILPITSGLNFGMLAELLGRGTEPAQSTHADGWETSLMLFYYPDAVRPGYTKIPQTTSSIFFATVASGDRTKNPSGVGGFPFDKASAAAGRQIADYRTARIGDAILAVLRGR